MICRRSDVSKPLHSLYLGVSVVACAWSRDTSSFPRLGELRTKNLRLVNPTSRFSFNVSTRPESTFDFDF